MRVKCTYCGNWIDESDETCESCGAANESFKRVGNGVPTTIAELKSWANEHHLPLADMRTYIGVDYKGARAFGIYQEKKTGNFIVYKNKDDGTRVIRYEGPDEAYAVNELYLKMKERVATQKSHQSVQGNGRNPMPNSSNKRQKRKISAAGVIFTIVVLAYIAMALFVDEAPQTGYYYYDSIPYYYQSANDSWYEYDFSTDTWETTSPNSTFLDQADDYFDSSSYSYDSEFSDFEDSEYYTEPDSSSDSDSDWDSGSDWDSDSDWDSGIDWDSGYDDWGSDW